MTSEGCWKLNLVDILRLKFRFIKYACWISQSPLPQWAVRFANSHIGYLRLEMTENFKDDREVMDVMQERLAHRYGQILNVGKRQRSLARILNRFGRKRLVVTMQETENIII